MTIEDADNIIDYSEFLLRRKRDIMGNTPSMREFKDYEKEEDDYEKQKEVSVFFHKKCKILRQMRERVDKG
jgi:hypothetical protein